MGRDRTSGERPGIDATREAQTSRLLDDRRPKHRGRQPPLPASRSSAGVSAVHADQRRRIEVEGHQEPSRAVGNLVNQHAIVRSHIALAVLPSGELHRFFDRTAVERLMGIAAKDANPAVASAMVVDLRCLARLPAEHQKLDRIGIENKISLVAGRVDVQILLDVCVRDSDIGSP